MNRYTYDRKNYSIDQLAYLAGIVDGEGSIYIGNFSCNKKTGIPYYQTNIQVTNTDEGLIDWLILVFGGLKTTRTRKQMPGNSRKQVYVWTASGERLEHLCQELLPYLICKKRQAEIMLEMRETFKWAGSIKGQQGLQRLPREILEKRERLMNEMRNLHTRTHSYKNHGHLPRVTMPLVLKKV